jgi:hypothetical protein
LFIAGTRGGDVYPYTLPSAMLLYNNTFFVLHEYVLMLQAMRFPAGYWLPSSDWFPMRPIQREADSVPETRNAATEEVTDVLG